MEATPEGRTWFGEKSPAARAANQVVEPEAVRGIQTQVINLAIGIVRGPSKITHATGDRVGAFGTELLDGVKVNPGSRPAYRFPSGSPHLNPTPLLCKRPSILS